MSNKKLSISSAVGFTMKYAKINTMHKKRGFGFLEIVIAVAIITGKVFSFLTFF